MSWKSLLNKFEPIDAMMLLAIFILGILVGIGKNGVIANMLIYMMGVLTGVWSKKNK